MQSTIPEVKQLKAITGYDPYKATKITNKNLSKEEKKQHYNMMINRLALSMNDFPGNKVLNITLMNACIANPENWNCSSSNIDKALSLDGSNGALLSKIASVNAQKGDRDAALNFLEKSANAPLFNDYRQEIITLFINALKPSGLSLTDISISAIGFEAALWYGDISIETNLCLSDPLPEEIIQTCLAYGKRLELDGSNLVFNSVGLWIQKSAYKQLADATSIQNIDGKIKQLREMYRSMRVPQQLFHDENFVNDWLTTITNYNESDFIKRMNKEAEQLMADPDYTPCP